MDYMKLLESISRLERHGWDTSILQEKAQNMNPSKLTDHLKLFRGMRILEDKKWDIGPLQRHLAARARPQPPQQAQEAAAPAAAAPDEWEKIAQALGQHRGVVVRAPMERWEAVCIPDDMAGRVVLSTPLPAIAHRRKASRTVKCMVDSEVVVHIHQKEPVDLLVIDGVDLLTDSTVVLLMYALHSDVRTVVVSNCDAVRTYLCQDASWGEVDLSPPDHTGHHEWGKHNLAGALPWELLEVVAGAVKKEVKKLRGQEGKVVVFVPGGEDLHYVQGVDGTNTVTIDEGTVDEGMEALENQRFGGITVVYCTAVGMALPFRNVLAVIDVGMKMVLRKDDSACSWVTLRAPAPWGVDVKKGLAGKGRFVVLSPQVSVEEEFHDPLWVARKASCLGIQLSSNCPFEKPVIQAKKSLTGFSLGSSTKDVAVLPVPVHLEGYLAKEKSLRASFLVALRASPRLCKVRSGESDWSAEEQAYHMWCRFRERSEMCTHDKASPEEACSSCVKKSCREAGLFHSACELLDVNCSLIMKHLRIADKGEKPFADFAEGHQACFLVDSETEAGAVHTLSKKLVRLGGRSVLCSQSATVAAMHFLEITRYGETLMVDRVHRAADGNAILQHQGSLDGIGCQFSREIEDQMQKKHAHRAYLEWIPLDGKVNIFGEHKGVVDDARRLQELASKALQERCVTEALGQAEASLTSGFVVKDVKLKQETVVDVEVNDDDAEGVIKRIADEVCKVTGDKCTAMKKKREGVVAVSFTGKHAGRAASLLSRKAQPMKYSTERLDKWAFVKDLEETKQLDALAKLHNVSFLNENDPPVLKVFGSETGRNAVMSALRPAWDDFRKRSRRVDIPPKLVNKLRRGHPVVAALEEAKRAWTGRGVVYAKEERPTALQVVVANAKDLQGMHNSILEVFRSFRVAVVNACCKNCSRTVEEAAVQLPCGHWWDEECLVGLMQNHLRTLSKGNTLVLSCKCTAPIPLEVARVADRGLFDSILKEAVKGYLKKNKGFSMCPSPQCFGLLQRQSGYTMCPVCCISSCIDCGSNDPRHEGKTCGEFKLDSSLPDFMGQARSQIEQDKSAFGNGSISFHPNPCLDAQCEAWQRFRGGLRDAGDTPNFTYAWHGCPTAEGLAAICHTGFDTKRRSGQAHGPGEYFGITPANSLGYAKQTGQMLICVLLTQFITKTQPNYCHVVNNPLDHKKAYVMALGIVVYGGVSPAKYVCAPMVRRPDTRSYFLEDGTALSSADCAKIDEMLKRQGLAQSFISPSGAVYDLQQGTHTAGGKRQRFYRGTWSCAADTGERYYSLVVTKALDDAKRNGTTVLKGLSFGGHSYDIDLGNMTQTNTATKKVRKVTYHP